jgi:hypothetical protein
MIDKISDLEWFGPIVLMVAAAIRLVRTRAEVAGWNTKEFWAKEEEERRAEAEKMRILEEEISEIRERTRLIVENGRIAEKEHRRIMKEMRANDRIAEKEHRRIMKEMRAKMRK